MHDRGRLEEAVKTYNRYRSPMAEASLEAVDERGCTVRIRGPFCRMCCDYDYVDDLRWELHALGLPAERVELRTIDPVGPEIYRARFAVNTAVVRGSAR